MFAHNITMQLLTIIAATSFSIASGLAITTRGDNCSSLTNDGNYTINSTIVNSGAINIEGLTGINNFTFCRVIGQIPYGPNNTLNFEVWLPENSDHNGRFLSVGNGGFAGIIDYATMLTNLNSGFAVGGCDSGHRESENGLNKPGEYVPFLNSYAETTAWIRDSIAMFTGPAKQIAAQFYQEVPKKAYYYGCSTGGAQGYALAQYYPEVFDGIFAGSAGNWYTHLILSFLWNGVQANKPGALLDQGSLNLTRDAVVKQCDALDGVNDGVVDDPTRCKFNVDSLRCLNGQASTSDNKVICLNSSQINTVKAFYSGPGKNVYPGFAPGSESEWLVQESALYVAYAIPILQNLVFKNLSYDYETFNFNSDVTRVDETAGPLITATSPRLDAFRAKGGKLIATQGWADPYNAPFWPIEQHNQAREIYGQGKLDEFWRLFMVPGGGHCGSASSYPQVPGTWHTLEALVAWVENGKAPNEILATKPADGTNTTKKLCPYPKHASHTGGDIHQYDSFTCV